MKEKIPVKTFYLMAVIGIGLLGLAIGSTYAMFTASATIENPISFTSNLSYSSEVLESVDVTIAAGETKTITLNVVNSQTRNLKFASWYICNNDDVEVVATPAEGYSLSGTIAKSSQFAITVKIRNHGSSTAFVNLGVSSTISSGEIVLSSEMKLLEEGILTTLLSDFDYYLGSDATTISSINYYDETSDSVVNIPIEELTISSDEVLLVKYNGTDSDVLVPDTYKVNGTTYKTVVLSSVYICYYDEENGIDIDDDTGVFQYNTTIKKVKFGENVSLLSDEGRNSAKNLFYMCTSLTTAPEIPSSVTNMSYTFSGCTGLTTAPIIPSSVTNMSGTFYGCTGLTTAPIIPSSVTNMSYTFYGCTGLTTAPIIPSSVTNMYYTFSGCTGLTTAPIIPSSVTNMSFTFSGCTGLTTAPIIPSSVTNMSYTFYGCTGLTTAPIIPSSVTNMDYTFSGCTGLTTAPIIPSSVTNMYYTFSGCTGLTTAPEIPSSVTNMVGTFYGCTGLTTAPIIPSSVTDMSYTFKGCTSLTTAPEIPSSVTNMYGTFRGCTNLTGDVSILSSIVNIATYVFDGTTKEINVYVPEGSTTYTKFSALTTSNGMPSNVTLNTVTLGS